MANETVSNKFCLLASHSLCENNKKLKDGTFILNAFLLVIGTFGNSVSIIVFLHKKLIKHKFNWYLLIISVFKLLFCSILLIDIVFTKIYIEFMFLRELNEATNKVITFVLYTCDSNVALSRIFFSSDRLNAIKNPMQKANFITQLHAKKLIILSTSMLTCVHVISFIICLLNIESKIHSIHCSVFSPIILNAFPLIIILVLNILLVKEVVQHNRIKSNQIFKDVFESTEATELKTRRNAQCIQLSVGINAKSSVNESVQLTRHSTKKSVRSTKKSHYFCIIVSDLWSVFTSFPYYFLNSYFIFSYLKSFKGETFFQLQIVSSILFNSNHCVNFFFYLCFDFDFRSVLKSYFYINPKRQHL